MTAPDAPAAARRGPWLWLAIVAVVLAGGMLWILATREPPPPTPGDSVHAGWRAGEESCLTCHGVDGPNPRGKSHPLDQQCFRCHEMPRSR